MLSGSGGQGMKARSGILRTCDANSAGRGPVLHDLRGQRHRRPESAKWGTFPARHPPAACGGPRRQGGGMPGAACGGTRLWAGGRLWLMMISNPSINLN